LLVSLLVETPRGKATGVGIYLKASKIESTLELVSLHRALSENIFNTQLVGWFDGVLTLSISAGMKKYFDGLFYFVDDFTLIERCK